MSKSTDALKKPKNLSPRIQWLRNFYYKGVQRKWHNEFMSFSTGAPWDDSFDETQFYTMLEQLRSSALVREAVNQDATAYVVPVPEDFYEQSLVERKAWFVREVMVNHMPHDILPGDLLAGGKFNLRTSRCWTQEEAEARMAMIEGENGARARHLEYNLRGYGSCGPTPGHLIPGYEKIIKHGFKAQYEYIEKLYAELSDEDKKGAHGAQLRAMMTSCTLPRDVAAAYAEVCEQIAEDANTPERKQELLTMAANLRVVPWEGAQNFWQAVMSLWLTHMLVLSDENYAGPGVSFGRLDQYLNPYWEKSIQEGMDPEFGKDILKCFWVHCNTAYDAAIKQGCNQGITAGFGQLFSFSGCGKGGVDLTNPFTYVLFDVIDDMSPILEPKPNVRLHRNSPDELLDRVVDMIAESQGAPFLLNFDERSMAGLLRQAKEAGVEHLINEDNVFDYGSVGCLENTMVGNDRSETVNSNVNLVKSVELTLGNGKDIVEYYDLNTNVLPVYQDGPVTGDPRNFTSFDEFYQAFETQLKAQIQKSVDLYNVGDLLRVRFSPTPYLSVLVKGCAESGRDCTNGGAELSFATAEGVTFATTVDSLLAVKYLVFDKKACTMDELIKALQANWEGYDILHALAKNRAPKYGQDNDAADALATKVMDCWTSECWRHKTLASQEQFRAGMLSWNYWITYAGILFATPDGRRRGEFLSNAICPTNGADINGPTANSNSVGKVMGGRSAENGDFEDYLSNLPNGASHTITFSPSMLRDAEHRAKFKNFLRGYIENGGTALQVNVLDAEMLKEAQENPAEYRNLLVRVTGYNAYFTSIGKELQNEIIARESHNKW
jgi:formate C-acetyltransferase